MFDEPMDKRTEHMTIRLEDDLKRQFEACAIAEDLSPSSAGREAIKQWVERKLAYIRRYNQALGINQGLPGGRE